MIVSDWVITSMLVVEGLLVVVYAANFFIARKQLYASLELVKYMSAVDRDFQEAKDEMAAVKDKIALLYSYLKSLGSGAVHISGESKMFGKLDFDLELGKTEVGSDVQEAKK